MGVIKIKLSSRTGPNANFKLNHGEIIWQRENKGREEKGVKFVNGGYIGDPFTLFICQTQRATTDVRFVWGKNSWVSAFSGLSNEIKISLFVNRLGYPPFCDTVAHMTMEPNWIPSLSLHSSPILLLFHGNGRSKFIAIVH